MYLRLWLQLGLMFQLVGGVLELNVRLRLLHLGMGLSLCRWLSLDLCLGLELLSLELGM